MRNFELSHSGNERSEAQSNPAGAVVPNQSESKLRNGVPLGCALGVRVFEKGTNSCIVAHLVKSDSVSDEVTDQ